MTLRRLTVPALIATLLATAACSGNSAPGAAPSAAIPAAALEPPSPTMAVESIASAPDADDITPADIAAIDAPADADVADPTGEKAAAPAYGWPLTGFYHGKLKGYDNNGFADTEHSGYLAMHIKASLPSYTGTGVATEYGTENTLSFTLSGSVISYFPHGEYLDMTAVDSTGCPASGSARRYRYLFEGVLNSQGCGANAHQTTYYFKVRPNKT